MSTKENKEKKSTKTTKTRCKSLTVEGTKYRTKLTKKFLNRQTWNGFNESTIFSIIPGTILEINVKEGDKVQAGEILCILEAMKMKNNITCPVNGIIKEIKIEVGSRIPKNHVLMIIE